jgi:hypothetical protein
MPLVPDSQRGDRLPFPEVYIPGQNLIFGSVVQEFFGRFEIDCDTPWSEIVVLICQVPNNPESMYLRTKFVRWVNQDIGHGDLVPNIIVIALLYVVCYGTEST